MLSKTRILLVAALLPLIATGNEPSTCDSGRRQSPVDIRSTDVDFSILRRMHFVNYEKNGQITFNNTGTTVVARGFADWGNNQPHIFGGDLDGKYKLDQIHFHWAMENVRGSEHTFASLHYPVEVHFVHRKVGTENLTVLPGDGLAVIAVFLTVTKDGIPLSGLEAGLKRITDPNRDIMIEQYTPGQMLPNNKDSFYTYSGSLTTGACNQSVIWTILDDPSSITQNQLDTLRHIKLIGGQSKGNYRQTQPLYGRRIKYRSLYSNYHEICKSDSISLFTSWWSFAGSLLSAVYWSLY